MNSFSEVYELTKLCNLLSVNSLGVLRKDMPQIFQSEIPNFLDFLSREGVIFNRNQRLAASLKSTQKDFSVEKILQLKDSEDISAVIISADGYVLDGHHRWIKSYSSVINTIDVKLSISELLAKAYEFLGQKGNSI